MNTPPLVVGLSAVIVAADAHAPYVLATRHGETTGLPFGAFDPAGHRTFELGLRDWVRAQTGFEPGYVEQLYTFGDRGRELPKADFTDAPKDARLLSVGYLGLTPERPAIGAFDAVWRDWYRYFPWEDHRGGRPALIDDVIAPGLRHWAADASDDADRLKRARLAFALDDAPWIEERALERYELLYEAGLAPESMRDRGVLSDMIVPGDAMVSDHRRILATAIGRLRGKLKYRPVVFELTPDRFTLSQLQGVVESILGVDLHKQNFRRAVDKAGFVEGTGAQATETGGRPAELYRFNQEALRGGGAQGVQTPILRQPH